MCPIRFASLTKLKSWKSTNMKLLLSCRNLQSDSVHKSSLAPPPIHTSSHDIFRQRSYANMQKHQRRFFFFRTARTQSTADSDDEMSSRFFHDESEFAVMEPHVRSDYVESSEQLLPIKTKQRWWKRIFARKQRTSFDTEELDEAYFTESISVSTKPVSPSKLGLFDYLEIRQTQIERDHQSRLSLEPPGSLAALRGTDNESVRALTVQYDESDCAQLVTKLSNEFSDDDESDISLNEFLDGQSATPIGVSFPHPSAATKAIVPNISLQKCQMDYCAGRWISSEFDKAWNEHDDDSLDEVLGENLDKQDTLGDKKWNSGWSFDTDESNNGVSFTSVLGNDLYKPISRLAEELIPDCGITHKKMPPKIDTTDNTSDLSSLTSSTFHEAIRVAAMRNRSIQL